MVQMLGHRRVMRKPQHKKSLRGGYLVLVAGVLAIAWCMPGFVTIDEEYLIRLQSYSSSRSSTIQERQDNAYDDDTSNNNDDATITNLPSSSSSFSSSWMLQSPWSDMELLQNVTRCGADKCFFPSKTRSHTMGYLVAGSSQYPAMQGAFRLAMQLQAKFGLQHFNLPRHAPYLQSTTTRDAHRQHAALNALVQQPARTAQGLPLLDVYGTDSDADDLRHLVVQKVRRAPEPHLFLTFGYNKALTEQKVAEFAAHLRTAHRRGRANDHDDDPNNNHDSSLVSFDARLGREIQRLYQVLHAHPILCRDFQGLVDLQGHYYAIDLDVWDEWTQVPPDIDRILEQGFAFYQHVRAQLWSLASSDP